MLFKQNILSKLVFCIVAFPLILHLEYVYLIILYFLVSPKIFIIYFHTFLKIIPFFITYLLFGFIFDYDYTSQILFLLKISIFLLLSVYLTKTTSITRFVSDSKGIIGDTLITIILQIVIYINLINKHKYHLIKHYNTVDYSKCVRFVNSVSGFYLAGDKVFNKNNIANIYAVIYSIIILFFILFKVY